MSEVEWIDIFGDNLRDILDEHKMSQRELAYAIGVDPSLITKYLKKQIMPSLKTIINMSYALGCNVGELVDFGDKID